MKNFIKQFSFCCVMALSLAFACLPAVSAQAADYPSEDLTPSMNDLYIYYEYVIDKYDVNIIVNENNTLDITETITANFAEPKYGIFRTIPLSNTITRLDGTTSKNRTQVTNVSVDHEYQASKEDGNYKLQIGSPDYTLIGVETYVIRYTYNLGKDPSKAYDELYYNIIGDEWDTAIGNITFSIIMSKEFDADKLGFSSGYAGSTDNRNVQYTVNGNTITGSYNAILDSGEALTVRCELPEGYFVGAGLSGSTLNYVIFLIPIIFLGISIFLWYKFGRDDQVIDTVEFYPPEGFNSLEVGFLYKGKADNQDVTSLLIYLANKGYIKITETGEKSRFSKSADFRITKLKEYDGDNINERLFLEGLFAKRASLTSLFNHDSDTPMDDVTEVTSKDLTNKFYKTMQQILLNINCKENSQKIFEKTASRKTIFIILMVIATFCLITLPPVLGYSDMESLIPALLCPGIGFTFMFSMFFSGKETVYSNGKAIRSSIAPKLYGLVWGGLFAGVPFAFFVLPALLLEPICLITYIIGIGCILGMVVCLKYLPKRTPYGNEMLGKIRGFKNFLETAGKDRLEAMVMENPTCFYDILPFSYVLEVSDKWIEKFETIALQAPDWYDGYHSFDAATFGNFMNSTISSAQSALSSSPSSGSGSSGGGSSSGGSGGGGGGSW